MLLFESKYNINHEKIWDCIDRVVYYSQIEYEELLDVFELTSLEYARLRKNCLPIPLFSLINFCDHFKISAESIINGDIDYKYFVKNESYYLREKYSVNAFSRCRTVYNHLDYIEKNFGWRMKRHILNSLQVEEQSLMNLERPINIKLSIDIGHYFLRFFKRPEIVKNMGRNSAVVNKNSIIAQDLSEASNITELYELLFEKVVPKRMEKNYQWSIQKASKKHIYVKGLPNKEVVSLLGAENVYGNTAMLFREGFVSSVPLYLDQEVAKVNILKSVWTGDNEDLFCVSV